MSIWLIMHGIWCECIGHPLKSIINPKILFYLCPEYCKNTSSILSIWAIWRDLEQKLNVTLQSNSFCVTLRAIVNCFPHFHAWELLFSMPSQSLICAVCSFSCILGKNLFLVIDLWKIYSGCDDCGGELVKLCRIQSNKRIQLPCQFHSFTFSS